MGLYSGGLIIGSRILSVIFGKAYFWAGLLYAISNDIAELKTFFKTFMKFNRMNIRVNKIVLRFNAAGVWLKIGAWFFFCGGGGAEKNGQFRLKNVPPLS